MAEREVVIINGARTAIGKFGGMLKNLTVVDIGVAAVKGAIERAAIKPEDIESEESDEIVINNALESLKILDVDNLSDETTLKT